MSAPSELLALTGENSSFSRRLPGMQLAIDSTSLGDFKRCPRYYQYSIIMGLRSHQTSPHLTFGLLYHGAIERYHHAIARGASFDDALDTALDWALVETWDSILGRPKSLDHQTKNRIGLIRTIVWYLEGFRDRPDSIITLLLHNGKPAVELSFRFNSGFSIDGESILFCGHLDRLGTLMDEPVIPDAKTTERALTPHWFSSWTPGNQFSMYSLAGRVAFDLRATKIIVDAAQVGVNFSRFQRGIIERPESVVQEWHEDAGRWVRAMAQCAGEGYWPQNDKACDLFGGCQFRELCSRAPGSRDRWAEAAFARRVWDPLQVRGDI